MSEMLTKDAVKTILDNLDLIRRVVEANIEDDTIEESIDFLVQQVRSDLAFILHINHLTK